MRNRTSIIKITNEKLDKYVAKEVLNLRIITASSSNPMTCTGCRVSYGTWICSGIKSTWGFEVTHIPEFSSDWTNMPLLIKAIERLKVSYQIDNVGFSPNKYRVLIGWGDDYISVVGEADTIPRAFCLAALKAVRSVYSKNITVMQT